MQITDDMNKKSNDLPQLAAANYGKSLNEVLKTTIRCFLPLFNSFLVQFPRNPLEFALPILMKLLAKINSFWIPISQAHLVMNKELPVLK